jgi:hypothetical protein
LLDYLATTSDPTQQVHEAAIKAYRDRYGVWIGLKTQKASI